VKRFDNLQRAIVGAGVLVSLVWAVSNLRGLVGFADAGSGGLGAVSVGVSEDFLFYLVPIIVNVALARWARRHGRAAVRWRWAHLTTTLGLLGLLVISAATLMGSSNVSAFIILFAIMAVALPVQLFFAAGFLALAIRRERAGE
jgi:hypothetical protein